MGEESGRVNIVGHAYTYFSQNYVLEMPFPGVPRMYKKTWLTVSPPHTHTHSSRKNTDVIQRCFATSIPGYARQTFSKKGPNIINHTRAPTP